jgi:hypothetical protein
MFYKTDKNSMPENSDVNFTQLESEKCGSYNMCSVRNLMHALNFDNYLEVKYLEN